MPTKQMTMAKLRRLYQSNTYKTNDNRWDISIDQKQARYFAVIKKKLLKYYQITDLMFPGHEKKNIGEKI